MTPLRAVHRAGTLGVAAIALLSPWANYYPSAYWLTPVTLVCVLVGLLVVLSLLIDRRPFFVAADFFLIAYVALVALSIAWAEFPDVVPNYAYWWGMSLAAYLGVRRFCSRAADFRIFAAAAIAGVGITILLLRTDVSTYGRWHVFGHNVNFTAYVLAGALLAMVMVARYASESRWVSRVSPVIALVILWFAFRLGTMGAIISATAVTIVRYMPFRPSPGLIRAAVVVVFVLCIALALGMFDEPLRWLDETYLSATGDLTSRLQIWPVARSLIAANPFLGLGAGQFLLVTERGVGAHNFFLVVPLETGLVGVALMLGFAASIYRELVRAELQPRGTELLLLFSVYWFPIAFTGHWELTPFSWMLVALTRNLAAAPAGDDTAPVVMGVGRTPDRDPAPSDRTGS